MGKASECPECGWRRQKTKQVRLCDVLGCGQHADIFPNGTGRCWKHYREHMDAAGKRDIRDIWVEEEAIRAELTQPLPNETLKAYMARHGVKGTGLQRIPGADDE